MSNSNNEEMQISFRKKLGTKELDTVDIFTLSFGLYKENLLNFILLGLFLGLPHTIASMYVKMPTIDINALNSTGAFLSWVKNEITLGFYLVNFLSLALDVLLTISVASLVEAMIYRRTQSASWAIVSALKLFFPVLTTQIFYSLLVSVSFIAFIVPGIIVGVFAMFAVYSSSLRHSYGVRAFRYSIEMVRGRFFKSLFVLSFVIVFLNTTLLTIFQGDITSREGILSYFSANLIYHVFNSYFKVVLSLYFLNVYYFMNDNTISFDNN